MKTITRKQLLDLLSQVKGTTFVSLETITQPKLKSGNPFISLEKVSKIAGAIGFNYSNSVNNQMKRETVSGTFQAKPRVWGKRVENTPLVSHKDNFYLEVKVQNTNTMYVQKGKQISFDKLIPWMYNKGKTRQGVENEVILRDYSLNNIHRIKIDKEEYRVV